MEVDAITALALSVKEPLVREIGLILNDTLAYSALITALLLLGGGGSGKRLKVLLSILLAVALSMGVKSAYAVERPCAAESWCPADYSFPSLHAAAAFTLAIAFLNKKSYPYFLLFALFVCFTRLNLGVHLFRDVAGGLAVAVFSYYATDVAWPAIERRLGGAAHG